MKVKPMIGDYALEDIEFIESVESRALAQHRVPGLGGDYLQDLGTSPNEILIIGSKHGDDARDGFLTSIRDIFNKGEPTTFVADILTATDVSDVMVTDLNVSETAGAETTFRYAITIRKYTKPPEPPSDGLLDMDILDEAQGLTDALDALDALASMPNIGDPTPPLRGALDGVKSVTSGMDQVVGALTNLLG
jgi:hypothetical protein